MSCVTIGQKYGQTSGNCGQIPQKLRFSGPEVINGLLGANPLSTGVSSDITVINKIFGRLNIKEKKENRKPFSGRACRYCGINGHNSIIQCNICGNWFCNVETTISGSHVVCHLVRANHKEVTLHKDSLHCFCCGSRNIFVLGFVRVNGSDKIQFLCRIPCAFESSCKGISWDPEEWNPLIEDRKLVSWLVREPSAEEQSSARKITDEEINRLEKPPKVNKIESTFQFLNTLPVSDPPKTPSRFVNGCDYLNIFEPLIRMNAEYQTKIKEKIKLRWDVCDNKIMAFFVYTQSDKDINRGEDIKLTYFGESKDRTGFGYVTQIPDDFNQELGIAMNSTKDVPTDRTTNFVIEFLWETVSFNRYVSKHLGVRHQKNNSSAIPAFQVLIVFFVETYRVLRALRKFAKNDSSVSDYLHHKLLGKQIKDVVIRCSLPKQLSAPNLPKLNESQINAVQHSVKRALSLIQGPPGTGKTVTSATIVYHLVKRVNRPILVCAPSNVAVDHLTEKIHKTGLKVVRLCAKTQEEVQTSVSFLSLHKQMLENCEELRKLQKLRDKKGFLSSANEKKYLKLKNMSERKVLDGADVICCTCIAAGDHRLQRFRFHSLLIDESTQTTEPDCLVPLVLGVKQLILVGDHKQLGPVVKCQKAERDGLSQSLFERLVGLGIRPLRLQIQYRMHPSLSEFSSKQFYGGLLEDGVTSKDRVMKELASFWPQPDKPMFFYCCKGLEEFAGSGFSYLNRSEASIVEQITTLFLKRGIKPQQIGVITPYEGQRAYIFHYLKYKSKGSSKERLYQDIEVASVNAFQGREKDLIIFSCVRSNKHQGIGFLNDPRRLNVALTRARNGLIVIGNPTVLSKDGLWNNLLNHYKDNKVLVEGPLNDLRESHFS